MKKFYNLLIVLALPALLLILTSEVMYPTASPGSKTGSPGDNGVNCTQCHTGTPTTVEWGIYSSELLLQGYSPGQTYNFFAVGQDNNANKFGFEATAEDDNGNKVGTFEPGILGMTQVINNSKAITHTVFGTTPLVDSGTIWMFTWVAPVETVGTVTFYAAVNAANGNGASSGDQIYLSAFPVSPATGVFDRNSKNEIVAYPNPSSGIINIDGNSFGDENRVDVLNLSGQLIHSQQLQGHHDMRIDLTALDKGVYIIRVGDKSQQLILH